MTYQDFDHALLVLEAWREAGNETIDMMICVAHTIMNLAKRDEISVGDAIIEHQKMHGIQFGERVDYPDVRDPRIMRLLQRIDDIDSGEDLTNGGIYYVDITHGVPKHMEFLLSKPIDHPMVAICGKFRFFK